MADDGGGPVCLDMLRSRKSRGEDLLSEQPPNSAVSQLNGMNPEDEALLAESVGLALLVVLERLAPAERLAFVLHDMFAVSFDEIAAMVGRSPAAARQLASRARRRVQGAVIVPDAGISQQREVVDAFLTALRAGDFDACSRYSIQMLCAAPTMLPYFRWQKGRFAVPWPWRKKRSPILNERGSHSRC